MDVSQVSCHVLCASRVIRVDYVVERKRPYHLLV